MVTDVIDVTVEFPIPRQSVWDLLREPQTYPRVFPGIGVCEPLESAGGHQMLRFRVGTAELGVRTQVIQLRIGRWYESLELVSPTLGSFASIRLRGTEERTRISVTFFGPGRVHPAVAKLGNSAIIGWTERGLRRIADLVRGATTSVVVNGENSPVRRRAEVARQMMATGVVRASRPDLGFKQLRKLSEWGFNLAGGYAAAAAFAPERTALIDARGPRTFAEMHERTNAIAGAMSMLGLAAGDAIGLLARNHGGMVETMVAAGKLGVDVALLNTGLPARRIEEVVQRDKLTALFVDGEFDHLVQYLHADLPRYATDRAKPVPGRTTLDDLAGMGHNDFRKPAHHGKLIVLTSGTSGTPKGARRPHAKGFSTIAALLSRIPLRMDETMLIPAPLFHTWGLAALQLSTALRSTVVLPEQFDAEDCLRLIAEHRVSTFIAVPIMVHRILELPAHVRARYDTSSLRVVASCGAPLAASTVLDFMDAYGDVLYNVYGSTEVSWATIADPTDLRTAPTTAGRPPLGTKVAVLGPDRKPLPVGATGHIYVSNHMLFDGYVNAAPPDEADGMLDTGDLGFLDATGKLFIAGRDDEMIISGGENVFPRPVEEALAYLPQVREVAVVGVPDREYGQRLAAFVVKREGAGLDSDMVRNYIRNRLSRFSVPRDVTFLNSLPRGETGKILKRLLTGGPEDAAKHPIIGTIAPGSF
ncbi:fatty-acyl-CoA synthase [Nocardia amikacinitolerans]|uniref:AMP-binding protein n=1 Tax=Nocardia amikacinitolerans TaxID=756689 RepID=UPI00082DD58A|nr:AMP-binding protein [Nocardia amikacinitolerans]MCP2314993.1 fatty-acyl-CoA synthase [Nocardia amikacinitolerans]